MSWVMCLDNLIVPRLSLPAPIAVTLRSFRSREGTEVYQHLLVNEFSADHGSCQHAISAETHSRCFGSIRFGDVP
jgi:hypothetical protein